jgi:heptosyltransferase II
MEKVLIIKLGYSETLDREISATTSLGDVLRTTVILHYLKDYHISWLVDSKAVPLLDGNPYIKRILPYNLETTLQLQRERFDTVINLEKVPGLCALADSISAWRRFGFRFDEYSGEAQSYDGAEKVLALSLNLDAKKKNKKYHQDVLAEMLGEKWDKEGYVLGYVPNSKVTHDVGLNYMTGNKWVNKSWPKAHWEDLERVIGDNYSISWQKGLDNLYDYMDWINSCRVIVTNDSLGMHLAIALNKKVVAMFGPSSSDEVYLYDRGDILLPNINYKCIPCLEPECSKKIHCMNFIAPAKVKTSIDKMLK